MKALTKAFVCLLMLAGFVIRTQAASLVSEGTVQAILDPTGQTPGWILSNGIPNTGAMAGVWMPDPTNAARLSGTNVFSPSVITEPGGRLAIMFDGGSQSNALVTWTGTLQSGGTNLPAPSEYTGVGASNFSVEVWALAPTVSDYSTMVAWGQNSSASNGFEFNYGASGGNVGGAANYGANVFNWGAGGPPAPGVYHHLVTTFDGTTAKFYADGVLVNSSTGFAGGTSFAPAAGYPIDIGAARTSGSSTAGELGSINSSIGANSAMARMHIGKVRISDGVLTAADVSNNYAVDLPNFQLVPSTLSHGPVHDWVFNNPAGDAQSDAIVADLGTPGGQNATVVSPYVGSSFGALATFQSTTLRQGTYLHLDGGEPTNGAYVDLGPGLISVNSFYKTNNGLSPSANGYASTPGGTGKLTLEGWVHVNGQPGAWGTYFAFGATTATNIPGVSANIVNARFNGLAAYGQNGPGEPSTSAAVDGQLSGNTSGFQGANFWLFQQNGTDAALTKNDMAGNSDNFYGGYSNDITGAYTNGTTISDDVTFGYAGVNHDPFSMTYYAVSWDELANSMIFYINGKEMNRNITHRNMYMIYDRNGSLGRDFYFGNPLAEFDVYEFRIYTNILTPAEVLGDYEAGPGYVNTKPLGAASNLQIVRTSSSSNWVGSTAYFKVTADYASISPQALGVDVTANAVTFSNSNPSVLALTAGMIRFLSPGTATITAKYAGLTASSTITVVPMSATLTHRYSFSSDTTDNGPGPYDSINPGNNGGYPYGNYGYTGNGGDKTINGITGALITNGAGTGGSPAWVDFGQNFISPTYDALTVEMWATFFGAGGTTPLFSFGDERVNDSAPPAYLLYNLNGNGTPSGTAIPKNGRYAIEAYSAPNPQLIWSDSDPELGGPASYGVTGSGSLNNMTNVHIVAEYNPTGGFAALYVNGIPTTATNQYLPLLSSLVDHYNYIGESVNGGYLPAPPGSYTPNSIGGGNQTLGGTVNTNNMLVQEFRVYNGILAQSNIEIDLATGPSNIVTSPGNLLSIALYTSNSLLVSQSDPCILDGTFQYVSNINMFLFSPSTTLVSDNPSVLAVNPSTGIMTGVSPGTAHVIAGYPGQTSQTNTVQVVSLVPQLVHEWSFNTNSGLGGVNWDSIAGVFNATNTGGAYVTNGHLVLTTNGSGVASSYETLPANLITPANVVLSIECWASFTNHGKTSTNNNYADLWSLGSTNPEGNAAYYISLTPHGADQPLGAYNFFAASGYPNSMLAINPTDPGATARAGEIDAYSSVPYATYQYQGAYGIAEPPNQSLDGQANVHIVAIYHPFGGYMALYTNGVLSGTNTLGSSVPTALQFVNDTLSYLGRATDSNSDSLDGTIDEFRIWTGLFTPQQVALDYGIGPNEVVSLAGPDLIIPNIFAAFGAQPPTYDEGNIFVTSISMTGVPAALYTDGNVGTASIAVYGAGSNTLNQTFTGLPLVGGFITNTVGGPNGGVNGPVVFTSSNTNVVAVVGNNLVAVQPGTTVITASYIANDPTIYSAYGQNGSYGGKLTKTATQTVTVSYPPGPVQLMHRYSFNEPTNATVAHDSVGGPGGTNFVNATLNWTAAFDGVGYLHLDGTTNVNTNGGPDTFSDAETGPGLLAGLSNATFEWWGIISNDSFSGRIFDTGAPTDSSVSAADTNGLTNCYVDFVTHSTYTGSQYSGGPMDSEIKQTNSGITYATVDVVSQANPPNGVEFHAVMVFDAAAGYAQIYTNGILTSTNQVPLPAGLNNVHDLSTYFGRSHYVGSAQGTAPTSGGTDYPTAGAWDEFRVWNNALSSNEVYASYLSGPNKVWSPKLTFTPNGSSFNITYPYYATRTWTLVSSSSLATPVSAWTPVATTPVTNTVGGAYVSITVPVAPGAGNQFYILK